MKRQPHGCLFYRLLKPSLPIQPAKGFFVHTLSRRKAHGKKKKRNPRKAQKKSPLKTRQEFFRPSRAKLPAPRKNKTAQRNPRGKA
jgi:hypothetical protein